MVKLLVVAATMLAVILFSAHLSAAISYMRYMEPVEGIVDFSISHDSLCLERVNFRLLGQRGNFVIIADEADPGLEWVYQYFVVNSTEMNGEASQVLFDVKVAKSWIEEMNVDLKTISLNAYLSAEGGWERIEAVKFAEDSDYIHYRSTPPFLIGLFAVTGEPVPVEVAFNMGCDGDGVCEPENGEDNENCRDCLSNAPPAKCVPSEKHCLDDMLLTCSEDGADYVLEMCANGCVDGACVPPGVPTGMAVYSGSILLFVVVVLVIVIAYLVFTLKGLRRSLSNVERVRASHEQLASIARKGAEQE
jgi:PGF-pre-PGF domain-containing protein